MIDSILDMWVSGRTAYQIGADLGLIESTIKRVVEVARRQRDPRAVLHRYTNGRFYGCQRAAKRTIVLWPQIRVVTIAVVDQHFRRQRQVAVRTRQGVTWGT